VRIFWVDILTFDGFFGAKFDILKPRWPPTTDALGNLIRFVLLPGQRFDTVGVPPLIDGLAFEALIADKAFDSKRLPELT
jgi:hypothetical protein